ncbi:iron uptake transporter permease EfeU [Actinocorallia sp. A-T 12471]|uniref:iron uptake transporter permease EfeU n=1 Tax=Actinocorallia sp. A-T 12471 TaxID=3089813 RepID=UPI0029CB1200|nr:iron uptake transporter permease EfeU [Actinocorallia sp. A-T 12471]MDX6740850.1 iron uptake transporter permease EfeU [Actinocorallia sp. A-T 12471]
MFLGNYLIGLREGLEAALVVSILIAYLVKTGNRRALVPVWSGVVAAVAVSVMFALLLQTVVAQEDHFKIQELVGGTLSLVAVGLVTWMVFWMRGAARGIKAELEGRLDQALGLGPMALGVVAFLSVGREGLETALFLWTNIAHSYVSPAQSVGGALAGLATAVVLGYLLYRGGLGLNLGKFFTWTGGALVIVAAGVLGYGFHDLQEADVLPGLNSVAFQPSLIFDGWGRPGEWLQTILHGVFNLTPTVTWLQAVVWVAYAVPVLYLFLRPQRGPVEATA